MHYDLELPYPDGHCKAPPKPYPGGFVRGGSCRGCGAPMPQFTIAKTCPDCLDKIGSKLRLEAMNDPSEDGRAKRWQRRRENADS